MKNVDIAQRNEDPQEGIYEKEIQLEVNLSQLESQEQDSDSSNLPREWKFVHNHPTNLIIGDPSKVVTARYSIRNTCGNLAFLSQIEPKFFYGAEFNEHWLLAIQEELN